MKTCHIAAAVVASVLVLRWFEAVTWWAQGHDPQLLLVAADEASLARGQVVFNRMCAPCHGVQGAGDGPTTQVGMLPMPLTSDQARGFSDGYIYSIIRVGRGLMPAYGHQVTHFDRWNVVNYVRQLQGQ